MRLLNVPVHTACVATTASLATHGDSLDERGVHFVGVWSADSPGLALGSDLFIYPFIYMCHLFQQQGRCDGSTLT